MQAASQADQPTPYASSHAHLVQLLELQLVRVPDVAQLRELAPDLVLVLVGVGATVRQRRGWGARGVQGANRVRV